MGLERKCINGRVYFYYRYYYRDNGAKKYVEKYVGGAEPDDEELEELKAAYADMIADAKKKARVEEIPVYLL